MVRGVDTVQTGHGNVAIQDSNSRLSVRSQRRGGKNKNVANPTAMYNNVSLYLQEENHCIDWINVRGVVKSVM